MKQQKIVPKVAFDIFYEQSKWMLWFFGILTTIHIIVLFFNLDTRTPIAGYFEFAYYSTKIFMLVCGIMAAYVFLSAYVQQGVTRKDVYRGIAISAFGLSIAITLIPLLLNGLEFLLAEYTPLPLIFTSYGSAAEWAMQALSLLLNVFIYYLVGLLISIGYYRYGWITGFLFIGFAIIAFSLNGYFWSEDDISAFIPWIPTIPAEASTITAFIGSLLLIAVLLIVARLLTKRVAIKL